MLIALPDHCNVDTVMEGNFRVKNMCMYNFCLKIIFVCIIFVQKFFTHYKNLIHLQLLTIYTCQNLYSWRLQNFFAGENFLNLQQVDGNNFIQFLLYYVSFNA